MCSVYDLSLASYPLNELEASCTVPVATLVLPYSGDSLLSGSLAASVGPASLQYLIRWARNGFSPSFVSEVSHFAAESHDRDPIVVRARAVLQL